MPTLCVFCVLFVADLLYLSVSVFSPYLVLGSFNTSLDLNLLFSLSLPQLYTIYLPFFVFGTGRVWIILSLFYLGYRSVDVRVFVLVVIRSLRVEV